LSLVTVDTLLEKMRQLNKMATKTYNLAFNEIGVHTPSYTGPRLQVALIYKHNMRQDAVTGMMDYTEMNTLLDSLCGFMSKETEK